MTTFDPNVFEPEASYRRLLRWYPASYRAGHEEEMLGVLLASAEAEGRDRPDLRDRIDLIGGGLMMRLRRLPAELRSGPWADAAALVSLLVPLALLAGALRYAVATAAFFPTLWEFRHLPEFSLAEQFSSAPAWGLWAIGGVAALCGARRVGAGFALAGAVFWTIAVVRPLTPADSGVWVGADGVPACLGVLAAVALLASAGAARGRALLGPARLRIALVLALLPALTSNAVQYWLGLDLLTSWDAVRAVPLLIALAAGMLLLSSPAGRRALVLLALPLTPMLLMVLSDGEMQRSPLGLSLTYLGAPAVAAGLFLAVVLLAEAKAERSA